MHLILSYIKYLFNSKSKYRIHSPFVFEFINNVLSKKNKNLSKVQKLIDYYKKNPIKINNEDLGVGSKYSPNNIEKKSTKEWLKNSSSPIKYGKILNNVANFYNCKKILELGTNLGVGTAYLSSAKNEIISIEGNKSLAKFTEESLIKNDFKNIAIEVGNFDELLENILDKNKHFDLYFIDGNHSKSATLKYFYQILPYIQTNDIVIFDDINWTKEMNEAWQEIHKNEKVRLSIDLYKLGIIFFREEQLAKEHHILWY